MIVVAKVNNAPFPVKVEDHTLSRVPVVLVIGAHLEHFSFGEGDEILHDGGYVGDEVFVEIVEALHHFVV